MSEKISQALRLRLTEDWLATLIGLALVAIIGAGLFEFGSVLPWPVFGLFGQ